ncbi:MAG: phospholipase D family protein [Deltaproteobacteria bacterium]|nr:phospholipase D family protein [Deltaproteobacteria bacterium]
MEAIAEARVSVWIASANVKDLQLEAPRGTRARARDRYLSILDQFETLQQRGVELRLLHGGPLSRPFLQELRRHRSLQRHGLAIRHCPRVHFKVIAVDGGLLYLGSANLTGAGLGAKHQGRRNFEAGILTRDERWLDEMQAAYEAVWSGRECAACKMRHLCPAPLDRPPGASR